MINSIHSSGEPERLTRRSYRCDSCSVVFVCAICSSPDARSRRPHTGRICCCGGRAASLEARRGKDNTGKYSFPSPSREPAWLTWRCQLTGRIRVCG